MGKLRVGRLLLWLITGFAIGLTLLQIANAVTGSSGHHDGQDAAQLLFQVSQFQMELLAGTAADAGKAKQSDQLNALKQMAYSANFTHERLVTAIGEDRLSALVSVQQLLQYIIRLQIGGDRPLKQEETQTLEAVGKLYKQMNDDYGKLITSTGSVISSQNDKILKTDKAIVERLKGGPSH